MQRTVGEALERPFHSAPNWRTSSRLALASWKRPSRCAYLAIHSETCSAGSAGRGSPARTPESVKFRPTNAAVLREVFACSAISFSRSKARVNRAFPARKKHEGREPENERHRRIEEFGPDIAIEPHEIVELDAGRIGALDPDVGLREAIRNPCDRLHLAMGDDRARPR